MLSCNCSNDVLTPERGTMAAVSRFAGAPRRLHGHLFRARRGHVPLSGLPSLWSPGEDNGLGGPCGRERYVTDLTSPSAVVPWLEEARSCAHRHFRLSSTCTQLEYY